MDDVWVHLNYAGKCGEDGFPLPGDLIRQNRIQLNMSQEQLACKLGCSRAMVARMENENLGMNDIMTRRKVAKALSIAPVMLGLVAPEEVLSTKPTVLYDTALLKKSLALHREVYFAGGNVGGIQDVDATAQYIFDISKSLDHKNKDILEILCHYGQLGLDIGREEQNYRAVERYGNWALSIARKCNDPVLLASTLMRYSSGMFEKGDMAQARRYADEALAQRKIPSQLLGGTLLEASKVYAKQGDPQVMKFLDKASTIAQRKTQEEDAGFVKLTTGFCHLRTARVLYEAKEYRSALEELDLAEEQTAPNLVRRKCAIQVLQAQILLQQGHYAAATEFARTALTMASAINSTPNLAYLALIKQELKESSFGNAREVTTFGKAFAQAVGNRKLHLPV